MTFELFATVPQAMESLLATELKGFGAQNVKEKRTGVSFSGGLDGHRYRAGPGAPIFRVPGLARP